MPSPKLRIRGPELTISKLSSLGRRKPKAKLIGRSVTLRSSPTQRRLRGKRPRRVLPRELIYFVLPS